MAATVKGARKVGIDERLEALRLQVVAGEIAARIGRRIRQRRDELGLTQKQVAVAMPSEAVDAQRISDWERGYNKPSERYLNELVAALDVPDVSYFYEQPDAQPETPDPFAAAPSSGQLEAKVDRISEQVEELHDLLLGGDEAALDGLAGRLLQAAGLPQKPAAARPATRPGGRRRKPA